MLYNCFPIRTEGLSLFFFSFSLSLGFDTTSCSILIHIMRFSSHALWASFLLASAANAGAVTNLHDRRSFVERDGVNYTVFEHAATGAKLEFVKNSGICETTPGVNQYSGYLSVGDNMNMWFWYVIFREVENSISCRLTMKSQVL